MQWLGHECDEGNRNQALLEGVLEREGEKTGSLRNKLQVEEHKSTLLRGRLAQAQAEQQQRDMATD